MALIFLDSFDHYAYADILKKWSTQTGGNNDTSTITTVGRRSTNGLRLSHNSNISVTRSSVQMGFQPVIPAISGNTVLFGFSINSVTAPSVLATSTTEGSGNVLFSIQNSGTTRVWGYLNTDGTIAIMRGTSTLATTTAFLVQNTTYKLEFKIALHASAGTVDIQRDGFSIMSISSQNTGGTGWTKICIGPNQNFNAAGEWDIDDFHLADGSGATWNDFVGDVRIDAIYPNADGNSSGYTLSTGATHFGTVDETPANGDTDYNSTAVVGTKDTLNFPNTATSGAIIKGLQIVCEARKTDTGTAGHKAVTRIGSTDYDGTENPVASSYLFLMEPQSVKPSDSIAWTESDFNAAEFGYRKST